MIRRFTTMLTVSLALLSTAAPAMAQTAFRSVAPQNFSSQELQQYGLDATSTERAIDLQRQGYDIRVLSEAEAANYRAGMTDSQWLLIGILAGVIVIAVAVG